MAVRTSVSANTIQRQCDLLRVVIAATADSLVWPLRIQTPVGAVLYEAAQRMGEPHRYDTFILNEDRGKRARALTRLGELLLMNGDTSGAETAWHTALTIVRNPGPAARQLALLAAARGDSVTAAEWAGRAYVTTFGDTLAWRLFLQHARALLGTNTFATRARYLDSLENVLEHEFELPRISPAPPLAPEHGTVFVVSMTAPDCPGCRVRDLLGDVLLSRYRDGSVIYVNQLMWAPFGARGTTMRMHSDVFLPEFPPFDRDPESLLWINGRVVEDDRFSGDMYAQIPDYVDRRLADIDRNRIREPGWNLDVKTSAKRNGVDVAVNVRGLRSWAVPRATTALRIALVEDSILYTGLNGVRRQRMVIRAWAGDSAAAYAFSIHPPKSGARVNDTVHVTFDFDALARELRAVNMAAVAAGEASQADFSDPEARPIPAMAYAGLGGSHRRLTAAEAAQQYEAVFHVNPKHLYILVTLGDTRTGIVSHSALVRVPAN